MAGFSLTPTPPFTHDKQWDDLLDTVKSLPGVDSAKRERVSNQIWVGTKMSEKELADALDAAGITASVN
jgi:hypothetical protein